MDTKQNPNSKKHYTRSQRKRNLEQEMGPSTGTRSGESKRRKITVMERAWTEATEKKSKDTKNIEQSAKDLLKVLGRWYAVQENFDQVKAEGYDSLLTKKQTDNFTKRYKKALKSSKKFHNEVITIYEQYRTGAILERWNSLNETLKSITQELDNATQKLEDLKKEVDNEIRKEKDTENDVRIGDLNKQFHKSLIWFDKTKYKYRTDIKDILEDTNKSYHLLLKNTFIKYEQLSNEFRYLRTTNEEICKTKISSMFNREKCFISIINSNWYRELTNVSHPMSAPYQLSDQEDIAHQQSINYKNSSLLARLRNTANNIVEGNDEELKHKKSILRNLVDEIKYGMQEVFRSFSDEVLEQHKNFIRDVEETMARQQNP